VSKRDNGLHAYKHRHVHADLASTPCRHHGGCGCGFAHRSRSRVPLASELRRSFSPATASAERNSILEFSSWSSSFQGVPDLGGRWCMSRGHGPAKRTRK